VLIGRLDGAPFACQIDFRRRDAARGFVQSSALAHLLRDAGSVQVAAISPQPRVLALVSGVLARLLPHWPFDNSEETGADLGGEPSVVPTDAAIAELTSHPQQDTTIVMVNWLRFRERAAYQRYAKVAVLATHSLRAKIIHGARYQQILIGNGGDPGLDLWHEFVLMQYPGRATFQQMSNLRRYRRALGDRAAGLAVNGQGLVVARPFDAFVWKP
jgi:hypothetical protein